MKVASRKCHTIRLGIGMAVDRIKGPKKEIRWEGDHGWEMVEKS